MKTFTLSIVADSKTFYSGLARYCGVTTLNGEIGFEAGHEPFFGVLKDDTEIRFTGGSGEESSVPIEKGMVFFNNNTCSVAVSVKGKKSGS